jgi:hypothetical protein
MCRTPAGEESCDADVLGVDLVEAGRWASNVDDHVSA